MNNIHKKTHFKAAISIARGDACCLKLEQNEFGDQFAEIARNIEQLNKSVNNMPRSTERSNANLTQWLRRNRTSHANTGRQRFSSMPFGETPVNDTRANIAADSALEEGKLLGSRKDLQASDEWKRLSEEEKAAVRMLQHNDVSAESVTQEVLKLCNVVRQPLDIKGEGSYMKKRTGLGGTGGRQLSPQLREKFGTFGFKSLQTANKRQSQSRPLNFKIQLDDRATPTTMNDKVASASTMPVQSNEFRMGPGGNLVESQTRMTAGTPQHYDTGESVEGPPIVSSSVNMGMQLNEDIQ